MEPPENKTIAGFILLGFSDTPHLLHPLFSFFLVSYVLCIAGNTFIFMLIVSQLQLHTPMYILMGNLAFVDVCFTSIIVPRTLYGLLSGDIHISIHGCFVQLFLFLAVANMDSYLLAIMAFDRYCAVCFPLRYLIIMNSRTCNSLVAFCWTTVCLHSAFCIVLTTYRPFCRWVIPHYFCDLPIIMQLSCSGGSEALNQAGFIEASIVVFSPMLFILITYILIIRAVLALKSSQAKRKTFSTCSSHLTMVILLYSTIIFMYFRPSTMYSPTYDRDIILPSGPGFGVFELCGRTGRCSNKGARRPTQLVLGATTACGFSPPHRSAIRHEIASSSAPPLRSCQMAGQ
ncbi:PREDICTED: olfactory receptor 1L4-like [Nanorana parkeri]|uniref:olfactory receptor 1L4-like n=1 Tax=Nanorana parkeri TaxID=125878 RepID=UPI0008549E94|nr:PREDICTED: olfactory receptor 1L4-like [Nanorana parkeri]